MIYLINEDRTIELPEEIKGNQSITDRFSAFRVIKDGSIYVLDKEWNLYIYSIRTEQMRHWELPVEWESKINDLIFFDVDPITNEWIFYQQNQLNIVQGDDPTIVQTIPLDHLDMQWPNVAFDEKKREIRAVDGSSRVLFKRTAAGGYEELEIDPVQKMLEEYSDKPTGSFYTYNDQRRYSISIEKEKWKSSPYEIRLYDDWFDTNTVLYRAEDPALSYSEFARGDASYLSFFTYKTDQEGFFKRSTMLVDYSNLSYHVEDVQLERKFEGYDVLQPIPLNVIVKQGNHTRTVRNPEIQWDISDPSVAKIEGSFLVFLKEGTVTLKTTILGHLVEQTFSTNQIFQANPEVSYNEAPVKEVVLLEGTTELTVFLNEWIQLDKQTEDSIRLTKDGVPVAFQVRHWRNEIVLETEYPYVEGRYELWIDGTQSVKKTTVEPVHWPIEVVIKPTGKLLDPPLAEKQHILFQ